MGAVWRRAISPHVGEGDGRRRRHNDAALAFGSLIVDDQAILDMQDAIGERDLFHRLFPLCRAMFIETNPIPVKEAMAMLGMIAPEFRLPLCRMADANRERLKTVLRQFGLLKV